MSDFFERLKGVNEEASAFRKMMEEKYKGDPEEVKKLLIDLLCLIHVEFYIRPQFKEIQ